MMKLKNIFSISALFLPNFALAHTGEEGTHMMGMMGLGAGFGWVFMALVFILLVVAIIALLKWTINQDKDKGGSK